MWSAITWVLKVVACREYRHVRAGVNGSTEVCCTGFMVLPHVLWCVLPAQQGLSNSNEGVMAVLCRSRAEGLTFVASPASAAVVVSQGQGTTPVAMLLLQAEYWVVEQQELISAIDTEADTYLCTVSCT